MRRAAAILMVPCLLWALAPPAGAQPSGESLYRGSSSATAFHGFYDHEGLFPVPIMNVSVPYTEATLEPGPSSSALASFLWDPEVAELGTILCVLSDGGFCEFPDYPFQDRESHPAAGEGEDPPRLEIDDPEAPLQVRAAHQDASADEEGARARASVARLAAIPMDGREATAARALSAALASAGSVREPTPWLVAVREAVSASDVSSEADGAVAVSESEVRGFELLGGLVTVRAAHGRAEAAVRGRATGSAESTAAGVRVAGLRAEIGPDGIRIDDRTVGEEQLEALNDALEEALDRAGLGIAAGREWVRRSGDAADARAYAFSVDVRRRNVPEQFPEGTKGADVVRIPVGLATAEVGVAVLPPVPAADPPTDAPPPVAPGGVGPVGVGGLFPSPQPAGPLFQDAPAPAPPQAVSAQPIASVLDAGIPLGILVLIALTALAAAVLLTWLKVNEVLTE